MRISKIALAVLLLAGAARAQDEDMSWQITGQVVDDQGAPVEDFEVSTFWFANGNWWDEKGELLEEAKGGKLWTNEGVLAPSPRDKPKRLPEGRFTLPIDRLLKVSVFAIDKRHERGGIALVDRSDADKPVTITLVPLVRVTGEIFCAEAGRTPDWTNARVSPIGDEGPHQVVERCGSFRGKMSLLLPPGEYDLEVYSESPAAVILPSRNPGDAQLPASMRTSGRHVEIPAGQTTLDLGVLNVQLPRDKDGVARDYTLFYGKEPPALSITDARGVPKDVTWADLRGKWVLVEFWSTGCGPCIVRGLPELTKFYEDHAADRDRFEILAICVCEARKGIHTIEAYDALAAPVVKEMWAGKDLPYPVLVDGEEKTAGVFGIMGLPTTLLVDPEGHLVHLGVTQRPLEFLTEMLAEKSR